MWLLSTSVRWVVSTVPGSTTVKPRNEASSRSAADDPGGGQAEGRLGGVRAGQVDGQALGIHDQEGAGEQFALAGIDFLDADAVFVGAQLHIVQDAHRRHDKAHLLRQLAAQRLDLVGDAMALHVVDQRQQAIAQFDAQQIQRQRGGDRLFLGRGVGLALGFLRLFARRRARPCA